MPAERHPIGEPGDGQHFSPSEAGAAASFQTFEAHVRCHAVTDRYVRNRVRDPERAAEVLREVHFYAVSPAVAQAEKPLPLLISRARSACAQTLRISTTRGVRPDASVAGSRPPVTATPVDPSEPSEVAEPSAPGGASSPGGPSALGGASAPGGEA